MPAPSSQGRSRDYLMVVQAPCYPVAPGLFATESAFAQHLKVMRARLGARCDRIVIAAPRYPTPFYEKNRHHLATVSEEADGISLVPLHASDCSTRDFWTKSALPVWRTLRDATATADVVHSCIAHDLWRPAPLLANTLAYLAKRRTLFFVDIDHRRSAWMAYQTGVWSRKSYLLCRYVYDPLRNAQIRFAVKHFSLVMLKSAEMVADFGGGRPHVHNFHDVAHSREHVISEAKLSAKLERLTRADGPLRLVYFGRLVTYKGLDRSIKAVAHAVSRGARVEFHVIGDGDQRPSLEALVASLDLKQVVTFHGAVPYGRELFDKLAEMDVALATPLSEDTPRGAHDAMASGIPIAAFDTAYYRDFAETGAVVTSPWPDPAALGDTIVRLDRDREEVRRMAHKGVAFALENTQERWLDKRIAWTFEVIDSGATVTS